MMFAAAAVLFLPTLFFKQVSADTYIFGIIAGILSVVFQLAYMFAFSCGKPVLVTTINNFSLFIPVAVSCLFLSEKFEITDLIALLFAAASIWFITSKSTDKTESASASGRWLWFALIAFLCGGSYSTVQKIYAATSLNFDVFSFVATTYITASLLSFVAYKIVSGKSKTDWKEKKSAIISGGFAGVFLGTFQCVNTYAASVISSIILYPTYTCSTNIVFAIIRMVFFKEKLSKKQILGAVLGLCSILFMQ